MKDPKDQFTDDAFITHPLPIGIKSSAEVFGEMLQVGCNDGEQMVAIIVVCSDGRVGLPSERLKSALSKEIASVFEQCDGVAGEASRIRVLISCRQFSATRRETEQ